MVKKCLNGLKNQAYSHLALIDAALNFNEQLPFGFMIYFQLWAMDKKKIIKFSIAFGIIKKVALVVFIYYTTL